MATFALIHADRIRIFDTMAEAAAQEIPTEGFTYNILHSAKGGGYILAQYDSKQLIGYLEKEDA